MEKLFVCQPNTTTNHLRKSGIYLLESCLYNLIGFALGSGTRREWSSFSQLFYNVPKALIILRRYASAYCFNYFSKIVGSLTNSWKTHIIRLWNTSKKCCGNQTEKQRHRTFSNLLIKGKLLKSVLFACGRGNGGVLQTEELAKDCTGMINKTLASVLEGKHPREKIPPVPRSKRMGRCLFYSLWHHVGSSQISCA